MEWIRAHPVLATFAALVVLAVAGGVLVHDRIASDPSAPSYSWGQYGGRVYNDPSSDRTSAARTPSELLEELAAEDREREADISLLPDADPFTLDATTTEEGELLLTASDIESFINSLSPSAQIAPPRDPYDDTLTLEYVYSFLPRGTVTTSTPQEQRSRTQLSLHSYGNEVGSYIQSFKSLNRGQINVLRQFFEDRESESKREAVVDLAHKFQRLGEDLGRIDIVPTEVAAPHAELAAGYEDLGDRLLAIANAGGDEVLLEAVTAYNETADEFAETYQQLVTLFSVHDVTFSEGEEGRIFVFPAR